MNEGLLWYDGDSKRDLEAKVKLAAKQHLEKYGRPANICKVHVSALRRPMSIDGIRVVPSPTVLKNHFWVGVEEE